MKKVNSSLVREKMTAKHITLQEMAEKLGYKDASSLWRFLNGEFQFKASHVPILMESLDLTMEELFVDDQIAKMATNEDRQGATSESEPA